MSRRTTNPLLGLFFMAVGAVCAGPVMGADDEGVAIPFDADDSADEISLFEDAQEDVGLPQGQTVEVGSFGHIDLHVKDLDLTKVLQLLSIQSQRNIVSTRNVAGSISADLYGVDFYDALDAILHPNGFGYVEKGNFIYVYTTEELQAIADAERTAVTKIVRLDYISGADASAFVSPLLSPVGSISVSADPSTGFQPGLSDGGSNTFAESDTLVIRDYAENIEEIMAIIEALDVRPKQLLVEATILQARLQEDNAFGVDFSVFLDLDIADFTSPLGAVDDLISGSDPNGVPYDNGGAIQSNVGNTTTGASGVKVGYLDNDFAVFIRALDQVTDTTVLATPKVLVLNRQKADLLVGERLGYLSTTATDTATTQTVEFLDVGTQLTLRPFISSDDTIRLELRPSLSDGSTALVGGFVIPNETTQELVTNVMVKSGQTVVIGGLFKEDTVVSRNQIPYLGDVPIAGAAFQGQDDQVERTEVIFLIKSTVMKDNIIADIASDAENGIEAARIGARDGLLPFSRTKMVNAHLKDAVKYINEGKDKKAMWSVDCALYLNPQNVDAIRLKEQLTGQKLHYRDFSILGDAVNGVIYEEIEAIDIGAAEEKAARPGPGIETSFKQNANERDAADEFLSESDDQQFDQEPAYRTQPTRFNTQPAKSASQSQQSQSGHQDEGWRQAEWGDESDAADGEEDSGDIFEYVNSVLSGEESTDAQDDKDQPQDSFSEVDPAGVE